MQFEQTVVGTRNNRTLAAASVGVVQRGWLPVEHESRTISATDGIVPYGDEAIDPAPAPTRAGHARWAVGALLVDLLGLP
jgi:hypothetical protein